MNIRISELAKLLNLEAEKTEKLVATMIAEERLKGILDQTENLLIFEEDADEAVEWNEGIKAICEDLKECVAIASDRYSGESL